jgi:iron-sulfur cluster assembly protein
MFMLTPAAAEQIIRAAQEQPDNPPLRVAAKFDDDGELVYGMGFDAEHGDDMAFQSEGVRILISPPSQSLLDGATLDFVEVHPGEYQFVFSHDQAPMPQSGSCGSGSSSAGGGGGCGGCGSRGGGCA